MRTPEQRVDLREQSVLGSGGGPDNRVSIISGPMANLGAVSEDNAEGELPGYSVRLECAVLGLLANVRPHAWPRFICWRVRGCATLAHAAGVGPI